MKLETVSDSIARLNATLIRLLAEYETEIRNTAKPGNPYINALKGRIDGIRESILALEGRD